MRCIYLIVAVLAISHVPYRPAWAISDPAEMLTDKVQESRAERIGQQLRCLVCQNESIEDSGADLAKDLRQIVRQRVAAGDDDRTVIAWMVARYGDFVRLRPPFNTTTLLLWGSPAIALGVGVMLAAVGRRQRTAAPAPLNVAEQTRLRTLLDQ